MIKTTWNLSKIILTLFVFLILVSCDPPQENPSVEEKEEKEIKFEHYFSSKTVDFKTENKNIEDHALFNSEIFLKHKDVTIKSFRITLLYDADALLLYNIMDHGFNYQKIPYPGKLVIDVNDITLKPHEYEKLFTFTWKASKTKHTDIRLKVDNLKHDEQQVKLLNMDFTNSVKILKKDTALSIVNENYSVIKNEVFPTTLYIEPDGYRIYEFDFDIVFEKKKIVLSKQEKDPLKILLKDFSINYQFDENRIHVQGKSQAGLERSEKGKKIEVLSVDFQAIDSGAGTVSIDVKKMATLDDIYLSPRVTNLSMVINASANKPVMEFSFNPSDINVKIDEAFSCSIIVNTQKYALAAYGIDFSYDASLLSIDTEKTKPVIKGADGFIMAYNFDKDNSVVRTTGFDLMGMSVGENQELLITYWRALSTAGTTSIEMSLNNLTTIGARPVPMAKSQNANITIDK